MTYAAHRRAGMTTAAARKVLALRVLRPTTSMKYCTASRDNHPLMTIILDSEYLVLIGGKRTHPFHGMLNKVSTSLGAFLAPQLYVDVPEGRVQQHLSVGGRLRVVYVRHLSAEV